MYLLMYKLTKDETYADNFSDFMASFKRSPKTPHGLCADEHMMHMHMHIQCAHVCTPGPLSCSHMVQ